MINSKTCALSGLKEREPAAAAAAGLEIKETHVVTERVE